MLGTALIVFTNNLKSFCGWVGHCFEYKASVTKHNMGLSFGLVQAEHNLILFKADYVSIFVCLNCCGPVMKDN